MQMVSHHLGWPQEIRIRHREKVLRSNLIVTGGDVLENMPVFS